MLNTQVDTFWKWQDRLKNAKSSQNISFHIWQEDLLGPFRHQTAKASVSGSARTAASWPWPNKWEAGETYHDTWGWWTIPIMYPPTCSLRLAFLDWIPSHPVPIFTDRLKSWTPNRKLGLFWLQLAIRKTTKFGFNLTTYFLGILGL